MSEILKHLGVFLGIISFFSGIAVLTMNFVFCEEKENKYYRILRRYHVAFFAYILVIFAYYYVEQFFLDKRQVAFISVLGNITLAILCISHAKIIAYLNKSEDSKRYKVFFLANVLYTISWIVLNIFWLDRDGLVNTQPGIAIVWVVEGILLISLIYFAVTEFRKRQKNKWLTFFLSVFVVEYVWEVMYDLAAVVPKLRFTYALKPFNIVFVIYFLVNVILFIGMYRILLQNKMKEVQSGGETQKEWKDKEIELKAESYGLTARECEVLKLILDRKSNHEIAEELFISNNTVKCHVSSIFKKTEVSRREALRPLFLEKE